MRYLVVLERFYDYTKLYHLNLRSLECFDQLRSCFILILCVQTSFMKINHRDTAFFNRYRVYYK